VSNLVNADRFGALDLIHPRIVLWRPRRIHFLRVVREVGGIVIGKRKIPRPAKEIIAGLWEASLLISSVSPAVPITPQILHMLHSDTCAIPNQVSN